MHDHAFNTKPIRMFDCIQGVTECTVTFIRVVSSTLVTVRCGVPNLNWERAEVVEARHSHWVIGEKSLNTLPEREPDTVAEFDMVETQPKDFAQHFGAIGVAT